MVDSVFEALKKGNESQQSAYHCLLELGVYETLAEFKPQLAGTVPLNIHLPSSDLDIIFEVHHLFRFQQLVRLHYGKMKAFREKRTEFQGLDSYVCAFQFHTWPIELFAQALPTHRQHAFRHMKIEARMLALSNTLFRDDILAYKEVGISTEGAFAKVIGMDGDPYKAILSLEALPNSELLQRLPAKYRLPNA